MADEQRKTGPDPGSSNSSHSDRRREPRHPVPTVYQRYIELKVKKGGTFVPVILHNFSGSGVLFESRVPFERETSAGCLISISKSLSREIAFEIRVKHCTKNAEVFFVGAAIERVADSTWFDVFKEVHDFIVQRQGEIY